ncbi:GspH/FimT family pseudopilin [Roseateles sp. DB2]|uniref:GspH/FimT family pseudopilin n=1 Tax=Roseateles sp. DB2 TaxID=3453717 RepID=UPI003EEBDC26
MKPPRPAHPTSHRSAHGSTQHRTPRPPQRSAPQEGFALLSALISVAVLALLSQIAWPALQEAVSRRRLETLAADFAHDLQLARSLALSGEQALRLSVTLAPAGSCYVLHQAAHDRCHCTAITARCEEAAAPLKHRWVAASSRIRIAANVPGVTLHPGEGFVTSAGTFRVEQTDSGRGIWYVLSPVGRVRRCAKDWEPSALPRCTPTPA